MGRQEAVGLGIGRLARIGALGLVCIAVAGCSSAVDTKSKYSRRVIEEGEPVPKGGGYYSVGRPYSINGRIYYPAENVTYRAEGIASWYGPDFHGRLTANGEIYDMHSISGAHTTLPIPSYARVTNLANGRSIIVRINDRGPYARNRIIDLSIGAARALDFYGEGLARVRVEYAGRAPLEGTDDAVLMATLRQGSPAPAPGAVMVASSKPFLPVLREAREVAAAEDREIAATPLPAERPFTLGMGSPRLVASAPLSAPQAAQARAVAKLRDAPAPEPPPLPARGQPSTSASAFAPVRTEALGLMSGRGLY